MSPETVAAPLMKLLSNNLHPRFGLLGAPGAAYTPQQNLLKSVVCECVLSENIKIFS